MANGWFVGRGILEVRFMPELPTRPTLLEIGRQRICGATEQATTIAFTGIAYADGRWVAAGQSYDGTTYSGRISYSTDDGILPLISLDDAYAYIRG